jgi:thioredoxin-dependent peroxiredoxin
MLTPNIKAPEFSLPDESRTLHTLEQYKGKWVILYFYPKDDTPGCTKEACSFRDVYEEFEKKNVVVLGISKDSTTSHARFVMNYRLPFSLLSDKDKQVMRAYEVLGKKKFMGREYEGTLRTTFLIDPQGTISKVYENVSPQDHAQQILNDLP